MELHCYDGPVHPPEKRTIYVSSVTELEQVVTQLIKTGENKATLVLDPHLLLNQETYAILERIVVDHPRSTHDAEEAKTETQAEAKAPPRLPEVVSYSKGSLEPQVYKDVIYQISEDNEGFRAKIKKGCGWFEPWDCTFSTLHDADLHAMAFIDQTLETMQ